MASPAAVVRLPPPHKHQQIFFDWQDQFPEAQALVAPCGTKTGKTWGSATWFTKEAMLYEGLYCAWIAPTYLKARIGYRYIKAMLPDHEFFHCIDGRLEIHLANGSFLKFLHGRDAEVTVEGEAVDRYVIDEAGKISKQVWFSLFTTITQTKGYGIVTGTPRGFGWYYDIWKKGKSGDPFFHSIRLPTSTSPYVKPEAIANAKRLLPKYLFDQYYLALFITSGSVFGDLGTVWDESHQLPENQVKWWVHPDDKERNGPIVHGMDIAKKRDYTVIYSVNYSGKLVGYSRFRHVPYPQQANRFELFIKKFFSLKESDNFLRYDATGVGTAFGDLLVDLDLDISITPVTFTNKSKAEMVMRTTMAIEQGWHKAPRIEEVEHEFGSYEVSVTKTGLHSYAAPSGEHDDIVSAAIIAISSAYQSSLADEAEKMLESLTSNKTTDLADWTDTITEVEDNFYESHDDEPDDFDDYLED